MYSSRSFCAISHLIRRESDGDATSRMAATDDSLSMAAQNDADDQDGREAGNPLSKSEHSDRSPSPMVTGLFEVDLPG